MIVKFPEVTVKLVGTDGNAFAILAAVSRAMRRAGIEKTQINEFVDEATSGDYDHLLQTAMNTVNVE
jgi:hypothetical protein